MSRPRPSFTVNVDVTNPGQFFACCGLLELAYRLFPETTAEGWFVDGAFCIAVTDRGSDSFELVFKRLLATTIAEDGARGDGRTRPVRFAAFNITLDWWIDDRGEKTPFKLWAGQQTSLGIVKDMLSAVRNPPQLAAGRLFDEARPLTGRFGVDPRAAWNALDVGFSPNRQGMEVATYPAVELLAAVGLQRFRPVEERSGRDMRFRYATWPDPLPPPVACAAGAGLLRGSVMNSYSFQIVKRGRYKGFDYAIPTGGDS